MFVEESLWLRARFAELALPGAARVLDIGSQSLEFRTVLQPWIEQHIHVPLRQRGATIVTLDFQDAEGVDLVADVTDSNFRAADIGRFDLVVCCNLLEHVTDRSRTICNVRDLIADGGKLALTVPTRFPYHEDPIDTMYRPSSRRLIQDVVAVDPRFAPIASDRVRCMGLQYYKSRKSRVRRWMPPLRWTTACVVLSYARTHARTPASE